VELWPRVSSDTLTLALLGTLALMLVWEAAAPYRALTPERGARWRVNIVLYVIGAALLSLLAPVSLAAVARWATGRGWGLFNGLALPAWLVVALSLLTMDLAKYFEHRAMHSVRFLWRIHRTHHSDNEMDATTSLRFHPLELGATLLADAVVIVALGAPAAVVAAYRVARQMVSAFIHGNVSLPPKLETALRTTLATPEFHRVHHAAAAREQGHNLSGGLIWWDRVLGTYLPLTDDSRAMSLGLVGRSAAHACSLRLALIEPFLRGEFGRFDPPNEYEQRDCKP
jgi:sterol desaturase/sphingolipid hydroxylase (fatty acid hydroxylase superfamily)